jgi:hypothetical protein
MNRKLRFALIFTRLKFTELTKVAAVLTAALTVGNGLYYLFLLVGAPGAKEGRAFSWVWYDLIWQMVIGLFMLIPIGITLFVLLWPAIDFDECSGQLFKKDKGAWVNLGVWNVIIAGGSIGLYWLGRAIQLVPFLHDSDIKSVLDYWFVGSVGIIVLLLLGLAICGIVWWIQWNIKKTRDLMEEE